MLLRRASNAIPARLVGVDRALLREQRDRADVARYDLALLLAQRGEQQEASKLARDLGFSYRLSTEVLCPPPTVTPDSHRVSGGGSSIDSNATGLVHVVDGGVPHPLLDALRHGFSPNAPFWKAHKYGQPGTGYFS